MSVVVGTSMLCVNTESKTHQNKNSWTQFLVYTVNLEDFFYKMEVFRKSMSQMFLTEMIA